MKPRSLLLVCLAAWIALSGCTITVNLGNAPTATSRPPQVATIFQAPTPVPPQPTIEILLPTEPPMQSVTVYFLNEDRFAVGIEPYEDAFTRQVPAGSDLPRAVLDLFFLGPTQAEVSGGIRAWTSGFTHVRDLTIQDGIARVYLGGVCANNGAAYSVAALIMKNLSQFPQITAVKIYDENDETEMPDSPDSSIPYCLEP